MTTEQELDLHWVPYGKGSGWVHWGTIPGASLCAANQSRWAKAVRVACAGEGGFVDMAQCYDAGVLSGGPLGANLASRTLDRLLGECLLADPEAFASHMHPAFGKDLGIVHLYGVPRLQVYADQWEEPTSLSRLVFGDTPKEHSRPWVECLARLLQDPTFEDAIMVACIDTLARIGVYGLGRVPLEPTREEAALLSFAVNNPAAAEVLWAAHGATRSPVLELAATGKFGPKDAKGARLWPSRVSRTETALEAEFP